MVLLRAPGTSVIGACVALAAIAGCTSGSAGMVKSPHATSGPVQAPNGSFSSVCRYFVQTGVLGEARRLAADGAGGSPRAVRTVRHDLDALLAVAPRMMQLALTNIRNQVGTAQTPQVIPDTNVLQGECRSRHLPFPSF